MNDIKKILTKLNNGEINTSLAIKEINKLKESKDNFKAKKIKIRIHDKENNKKINIPALPIWLVEGMMSMVIVVSRFSIGKGKNKEQIKENTKSIQTKDNNSKNNYKFEFDLEISKLIKKYKNEIFKVIKYMEPFKLVEIDDESASVEIYTK